MDIDKIKSYCHAGRLQWTNHCLQRLIKRNIARHSVKEALLNGKIIEDYPSDYPYPSCLVLGIAVNKDILHVVCGIGDDRLWIITAYRPTSEKWDCTFSCRKEQKK